MKLSDNWLTEHRIDLEYKQYILLGWMKFVQEQFEQELLYPVFQELIDHYRNLIKLKESVDLLSQSFPSHIETLDFKHQKVVYENAAKSYPHMEEIRQIIAYALPQFEYRLEEGKTFYKYVEEHIHIETVGLEPLSKQNGYFMLEAANTRNIQVYRYSIRLFENSGEKYRGFWTEPVCSYTGNFMNTPSNIKLDLIKNDSSLPNPATYVVTSEKAMALEETLLPVAKRILIRQLSH